jgi:hypothetical protein
MNKLVMICFLCLCSFVGISQETKVYPERTVYYKTAVNGGDLVYINTENYIKELVFFQYNETYISLNFYIGEYRYTYFFDYQYTEPKGFDQEIQYWRNEVNNSVLIIEDERITLYNYREGWAVVYHLDQ